MLPNMLPFLVVVDEQIRKLTYNDLIKAYDIQGFYEQVRMCTESVMVTPTGFEPVLPG